MDPVANFLISIKNASMVGKPTVSSPFSKMKLSIAELLNKRGFVGNISKKNKKNSKFIEVELIYNDGRPRISDVEKISKPSRRIYDKSKNLHSFKQGLGMYVLSTPKGILSESEAKKEKVGGEVLFRIW